MPKDWTVRQVENAKPGVHRVSPNLYLNVIPSGRRSWLFRYKGADGKPHAIGLGSFPVVTLAEARDKVIDYRRLIAKGIDPLAQKREQGRARAEPEPKPKSKSNPHAEPGLCTFGGCAEAYLRDRGAGLAPHTIEVYQRSLNHAATLWPMRPRDIDTADVLDVLRPMWTTTNKAARDARCQIEAVLDYAKVHGLREGENPARWRGHLDMVLAKPRQVHTVNHFKWMPYVEAPGFLRDLHKCYDSDRQRARPWPAVAGVSPRLLEFSLLTGVRPSEARLATWSEVNEKARLWTIPAQRMKMREDFKVPLSDRALAILAEMGERFGRGGLVFSGAKQRGKPFARSVIQDLLARMGVKGVSQHGFRTTMRTWGADNGYPTDVTELCLAHTRPGVEGIYNQAELLRQRRAFMADWAAFCLLLVEYEPPAQQQLSLNAAVAAA